MSQIEQLKSNRRGLMVVLSSPSGAGKTTLTRKLLAAHSDMSMSVSATTVEAALMGGQDVIFDIDWQGAQQLEQAAVDDLVKIFILPPDMRALEARLRTRAQDSDDVIAKRMSKSEAEISHWSEYDYIIVNEDVETALSELESIVMAERMKRRRQTWLGPFIKTLVQGG